MVSCFPCTMHRWERRRATGNLGLHAQATCHAASGGCGPTLSSAGTRAWQGTSATSHQEAGLPGPCGEHKDTSKEDPFHPTCPLAYQTLGRLPILALSVLYSSPGNHCELPPALSQSVLHPTDPHFNPQPPPGTPQETSSPVSKVAKTAH